MSLLNSLHSLSYLIYLHFTTSWLLFLFVVNLLHEKKEEKDILHEKKEEKDICLFHSQLQP